METWTHLLSFNLFIMLNNYIYYYNNMKIHIYQ